MIVTVTLNPAVDKTVRVKRLETGGLNRVLCMREDAGGKGINVSRAIAALGGESIATGFFGGVQGKWIRGELKKLGIRTCFTEIRGAVRTNLKVAADDGTVTEINEPGPEIAQEELSAFLQGLEELLHEGDLLVLSGSVPPGVPKRIYADLIRLAHGNGARALLDADGESFAEALAAGPDIIKPNLSELTEYCRKKGIRPEGAKERDRAVSAGRMLKEAGIGEVIVSMGGDGALFFASQKALYAPAVSVKALSTVGAGDTMAAAYALASVRSEPFEERVRLAAAAAAGAVMTEGTAPPDIRLVTELIKRVEIVPLEV